jgi:hypothetical protein
MDLITRLEIPTKRALEAIEVEAREFLKKD